MLDDNTLHSEIDINVFANCVDYVNELNTTAEAL